MSGFVLALIAAVALVWLLTGGLRRWREGRHDGRADGGTPGSGNEPGCASPGDGGSDCGGGDGGGGD
ncbi:MAG: hypothetical protein RBS46_17575 [Methyloversatilis sp.]|nr:hypothetical protein [Methyloversatilis sp.]